MVVVDNMLLVAMPVAVCSLLSRDRVIILCTSLRRVTLVEPAIAAVTSGARPTPLLVAGILRFETSRDIVAILLADTGR